MYQLDLSSLQSVRDCAAQINTKESRIDVLINNAGVAYYPTLGKTKDGLEMHMGTNHFGHFLFTDLLLNKVDARSSSMDGENY